jgi:hypothetical protein
MMGIDFSFSGVERGGESFFFWGLPCSQCVPNMVSSCSLDVPQVPKLFRNAFPVAPQFHSIWFAQSSTLMYINWKGRLLENSFVSILQLGASIGESSMFQKSHCWANEYSSFKKKNLSYEDTHELINMNHTKSPTFNVAGLSWSKSMPKRMSK